LYITIIVVFLTAFSTRVSLLSSKIHNGMTLLKIYIPWWWRKLDPLKRRHTCRYYSANSQPWELQILLQFMILLYRVNSVPFVQLPNTNASRQLARMFLVPYVSLASCGVLGPNWLAIDNILMCNGRKLSFTGSIPTPL